MTNNASKIWVNQHVGRILLGNKPSKMGMQSAKTRWSIENYRSLIAWIWNCHLWVFQISLSTEEWISLGFGNLGHRKFFPWLRFRTVSPLPLITLGYWLGVFRIRKSTWMRQPGWARGPSSSRKGITNTKKNNVHLSNASNVWLQKNQIEF